MSLTPKQHSKCDRDLRSNATSFQSIDNLYLAKNKVGNENDHEIESMAKLI